VSAAKGIPLTEVWVKSIRHANRPTPHGRIPHECILCKTVIDLSGSELPLRRAKRPPQRARGHPNLHPNSLARDKKLHSRHPISTRLATHSKPHYAHMVLVAFRSRASYISAIPTHPAQLLSPWLVSDAVFPGARSLDKMPLRKTTNTTPPSRT
jgi:hypothetical protein